MTVKRSAKSKNPKDKTVTVAIKDLAKVCHNCGKVKDSTRERTVYTKNYVGGCGDSFCWASCDSSSCKPVYMTICDGCEKKLKKPGA